MPLPASGQISMSQINTQLQRAATANLSLNDTECRRLAKKLSGVISINDFHGKPVAPSSITYTIANVGSTAWNASVSISGGHPNSIVTISSPPTTYFPGTPGQGTWNGFSATNVTLNASGSYSGFHGGGTRPPGGVAGIGTLNWSVEAKYGPFSGSVVT